MEFRVRLLEHLFNLVAWSHARSISAPYNRRVRLAWWSPWPPQRSGIAGRSAELVPLLAARGHAIDVFIDETRVRSPLVADEPPSAGAVRVVNAHDFVWRQAKHHYDLAVYQVGNSHLHKFIWPYLYRYPGLAVLHDGRVHHARAEALLSAGRSNDYVAEFSWSHPAAGPGGANFGLLGLDGPFYFQWPMLRGIVSTSRVVAAHSPGVVCELRADWPDKAIEHIALGEGRADMDTARARTAFRTAHAIPEDATVFGVFGSLTAEKRILEILLAFQSTRAWIPGARLLLSGAADPALGLDDAIKALGISEAIIRLPAATDDEFDEAIAAADVVLNLRWPTALETSGPWVRSLALARATVIIDLPHQSHLPALDPRTWQRLAPCDDLAPGADDRAITVAIDLLDREHSLRLAMRRLGTDAGLRSRIGAAARRWWEREHTVERMVADYERAMARAVDTPAPLPSPDWPAHIAARPGAFVEHVLSRTVGSDDVVSERLDRFGS
jgi:glycosyltransferase involved in cell wall biosynthesis